MISAPGSLQKSLQQQLDEITARTQALVPPERLAGTERLIAEVRATGQENRMLAPGSVMPAFALAGANGKVVRSSDLLALGPLVLKIFRGRWDPYDVTELEAWQALQPEVRRLKALIVGISPQTVRQNAFTADRHHITFPLLSDPGCQIANSFGLTYSVTPPSQTYLRSMLVNLPLMNGEETWRLPLPATMVIASDGRIAFSQCYADHRLRPEPETVLNQLTAMSTPA